MSRLDMVAEDVDAAPIFRPEDTDLGPSITGTPEDQGAEVLCLWRRDRRGCFPYTCWLAGSCCLVNEYYWPKGERDDSDYFPS